MPTAPTRLLPVLATGLPHKSRDRDVHCLALRGVFALAASPAGATIREGLLEAVVDHLLELDVEIRWQDISERPGAALARFFKIAKAKIAKLGGARASAAAAARCLLWARVVLCGSKTAARCGLQPSLVTDITLGLGTTRMGSSREPGRG